MSLPSLNKIFSSASFRLTLAYAAVFVAATLVVLYLGGAVAMSFFEAELEEELTEEVEALQAVFRNQGEAAIVESIRLRSRDSQESGLYYWLNGGAGVLAGNLVLDSFEAGRFEFIPQGEEEDERYIGEGLGLSDQHRLVVAIDKEPVLDVWELVLAGTGWTLGISLPLALICGTMMSAMALRRIDSITDTTQMIRAGGLSSRVALRGTGDEYDRLAGNINAMLDSIETLTRNVKEVSTGIAHDLRTPLTRVYNRLDDLQAELPQEDPRAESLEGAKLEVGALLDTFDALLRIGQIESGSRRSGFEALDLSALLGELAETYELIAASSDKTLTAEITPDVGTHGDAALLVQMFANVLENAIEHTPAHTDISLRLARQNGLAHVTIADTGPGIPTREHNQVFKRFYRLDQSRGGRGNGLGLSIVQSIAKLHDIDISLRDKRPASRSTSAFRREAVWAS